MKWSKSEQSNVEEPVWPGSQLRTEGTAATEAVKAWNDGSSLWRQWNFFQQQRLVACPWVIFQKPGMQPRVQYPAHCLAYAGNRGQCNSLGAFPAQHPASHSGTSCRAEPRAGDSIPREESAGSFISRLPSWRQGCKLGLQNQSVIRAPINLQNAVGLVLVLLS